MKKKILFIFGTRPEAIKMAPLYTEFLRRSDKFTTKVCLTSQHREMLDQVISFFKITPDFDLNIMSPNQTLSQITSKILTGLDSVFKEYLPNCILVHGDTTTTFAATLSAFYNKIDVAHIEAGLRTGDIYSPWPEEANRKLTTVLSKFHFTPTQNSKQNLLKEGVPEKRIETTGNTVIDALFYTVNKINKEEKLKDEIIQILKSNNCPINEKEVVLITGHRRENFGEGFKNICTAIKILAEKFPEINFIYPVHLNPNVQIPAKEILINTPNVFLIKPLEYLPFVYLMSKSKLIITDSGGIQEEAPSLNKPVLVMREVTERPEALTSGKIKLVGTSIDKIVSEGCKVLSKNTLYNQPFNTDNPYGDGMASKRIVDFFTKHY